MGAAELRADEGLAMQDPSGFNPERGGWDSSYHVVGLMYARRYEAYAAPPKLRPRMSQMLTKAVDWAASRLLQDGTMNTEGNTRVSVQHTELNREKQPKQSNYRVTFRMLYYQAMLTGDEHYAALAAKVARKWPELPVSAKPGHG
jgi:hypothetical protein